ncbi:MAG: phosphatase PAP2 family protein [Bdellovibrionota bacterium]
MTVWILITYEIPNKFIFFMPAPVPLLRTDTMVDFSPHWVWAYISFYLLLILPYYVTKNERDMNQMIYSYVVSSFLGGLVFTFVPTMLPRNFYPLGDAGDNLSTLALHVIRTIDASVNCFPSMHVALTTIAALTLGRVSRIWAAISLPWSLVIFFSTIATKQHYTLDVLGGLFFGLGCFWFFSSCIYVDDGSSQLAHAVGKKNQP